MMDHENGGEGGGFIARLRGNETLRKITGGRPDIAIFGAPVLVIGVIVVAVVLALTLGGGGGGSPEDGGEQVTGSPTAGASATPQVTRTQVHAGVLTPIPVSPGDRLSLSDLAARGAGNPARGDFTGDRLLIPSIGVDAEFSYKVVGPSGQMPNPNGPTDVSYYDFSQWPGMGGLPGKGGNVVLAGHVDYIRYGPAVFWDLGKLKAGDKIEIRMKDGSVIQYQVEFNKTFEVGNADWSAIVAATGDESVTLITCGGEFEAGHYSDRRIVWGRRIA